MPQISICSRRRERSLRPLAFALFLGAFCGIPATAQFGALRQYLPSSNHATGFAIGDVSGYVSRYWSQYPGTSSNWLQPLSAGSDTVYSASTTLSWTAPNPKANISILYSPRFNGSIRYSDFNRMNHYLSFVANHPLQLSRRWAVDVSGAAGINTFETYFFQPSEMAQVASARTSFDDLAATVLSRGYSNDTLGAVLGGVSTTNNPLMPFFFGDRFLNVSAQAGVTYKYSERLRVRFAVDGTRNQPLKEQIRAAGLGTVNTDATRRTIPQTTNFQTSATVSYSLSPRTELTGLASVNKIFIAQGAYYGTSAMLTLARTLSRRWLLQARGGASQAHVSGQLPGTPTLTPHYIAGGTIGFKTYRHTVIVNVDRGMTYAYGLPSTNLYTGVAWGWSNMRRSWMLSADVAQERFQNNSDSDVKSWRATVGVNRAISNRLSLNVQFAEAQYRGNFLASSFRNTFGLASIGLRWLPFGPAIRTETGDRR